ncbi:MAG: HAD-IIIC family phosphatase [Omnitrophica bacterium]|nr:HAD-IIIC family phosphatase [Candidatus Omnitrophota bacterium]
MNEDAKTKFLKALRNDIKTGEYQKVFSGLNRISMHTDDFLMQSKYAALFKAIPKDALALGEVRIAILATGTVSHFNDILSYWLAGEGLSAVIYEAPYGTVHQTILDPKSGLYAMKPDVVMIFTNYRDIKCDIPAGSSHEEAERVVKGAVGEFISLWHALRQNSDCYIMQNNADLPFHRVFGNYEGTAVWTRLNMLRNFNLELAKSVLPGVTIFDLDHISSAYGKKKWHDSRYWYHSKHAFALDATGLVAYDAAKVISATRGACKKCLIVDLDNTLWGGAIGDDGLEGIRLGNGPDGEAFVDFQKFLLKLKNRGIVLAVSSKNEEKIAKEPFLKHPHMQIKLDDVVAFRANWNDKVSNIKEIASSLNIGLDSIVFLDDNPAERQLVKSILPAVSVPELPEDPSNYRAALSSLSFFETVLFSGEDRAKTAYYRDNIKRSEFQEHFTDLSGYLENLDMEMTTGDFDSFNLPRIAQLINKSNQFHLTTTRYTESELKSVMEGDSSHCMYFKLKDCFGDNGLISAVILRKQGAETLSVDTWVMSCRVLSRGAEEFVCGRIVSQAKRIGCKKIVGKYIPTKRNRLVALLYERLGFKKVREGGGSTFWELDLDENTPPVYRTFIREAGKECI